MNPNFKHGMSDTTTHVIWMNMIRRCHVESMHTFKHYGGRGIVVCAEWRESFNAFLRDMGERPSVGHSIDRIDNDGPYAPGNCRWATRHQQATNTRNSIAVTCDGITKPVVEWCAENGVAYQTALLRLRKGVDPVLAVTGKRYAHRKPRAVVVHPPCWCGRPFLAKGLCSLHYNRWNLEQRQARQR